MINEYKYDIFISYSRHDSTIVDEFVAILEKEGFSVWIDRDGIESGDAFKKVILRAIKESQIVLFFSSEYSNQSSWTAKEIGVAVKYEKHIIPIKLDSSNFNEDVEFDLINLDYVDYSIISTRTSMKDRLLKTLRNKLGKGDKENERKEGERKAEYERHERERVGAERESEFQKLACPEGAINGIFSVSPTKKVYFSKGNLQYQESTGIWRFAERQYAFLGQFNRKTIFRKRDWIDLFGWGTGNNPSNCSSKSKDYSSFIDWGRNKINNGGNLPNFWHTLTKEEWNYLFVDRFTVSSIRYVKACVNNVNGVLLLPDDWNEKYYHFENPNKDKAPYGSNIVSAAQWGSLKQFGVVFLPAAGIRNEGFVSLEGDYGYYWSASANGSEGAYSCYFFVNHLYAIGNNGKREAGYSVRLVCSTKN